MQLSLFSPPSYQLLHDPPSIHSQFMQPQVIYIGSYLQVQLSELTVFFDCLIASDRDNTTLRDHCHEGLGEILGYEVSSEDEAMDLPTFEVFCQR